MDIDFHDILFIWWNTRMNIFLRTPNKGFLSPGLTIFLSLVGQGIDLFKGVISLSMVIPESQLVSFHVVTG